MNYLERYFPVGVVALAGIYLLAMAAPPADPDNGMHLNEFRQVPVQAAGRIKPFDTYARNTMMALSGRQTFRDENENSQPAIIWLLETMASFQKWREEVRQAEKLRIDDPRTLDLLGLEPRPDGVFLVRELKPKKVEALVDKARPLQETLKNAMDAGQDPHGKLSESDEKLLKTAFQISHYWSLVKHPTSNGMTDNYPVYRIDKEEVLSLLALAPRSGYRYSYAEIVPKARSREFATKLMKVAKLPEENRTTDEKKIIELADQLKVTNEIAELRQPHMIPTGSESGAWQPLEDELKNAGPDGPQDPTARSLDRMLSAYVNKDAATFNKELDAYLQREWEERPEEMQRNRYEVFFNEFEPFYQCSLLYVLVFVMACLGWVGWSEPLNRAAYWLAAVTLIVHTCALVARMYLMDRWGVFVTNLYSSAVFIGWGCVVLGLVIEKTWGNGIGNAVGGALGALALLIAHNLAASGEDTLEMMRAVLDTNFWLATHVTCVTLGYTTTFVAGFVGILFILRAFFTRAVDSEMVKVFSQIIYGIVCFATMFSFIGTVLGGIWADQSWGRFWGWDPKENGALIIVLWNALVLHARWGGMVKQRGMAVLAVVGNIVTSWSWFGVNLLNVGLHSYGFIHGLALTLAGFDLFFLAVIGIGMTPLHYWKSFGGMAGIAPVKPPRRESQPKRNGPPAVARKERTTAFRPA
jgi:ABC-type transport system involved in cytochrome c biogenesis permease subunit